MQKSVQLPISVSDTGFEEKSVHKTDGRYRG